MYGGQTGYTYGVAEGKITTGAEFLKLCARAFGCCGIFRDESFDTPLEELVKSKWNEDGTEKSIIGLNMMKRWKNTIDSHQ